MSRRLFIAVFQTEADLLGATHSARGCGLRLVDAHTPYPVHGLDEAMGLQPSRLPWVCFLLGLSGAALKVWFEFWTTATDWPINVGGKPWNSLPAFVPVTFEVMVLFAGLSTVAAFLGVSRLRPGRRPVLPDPGVTDDRFALVIEEHDASFDAAAVLDLFRGHHVVRVEEREEGEPCGS